LNLNGSFIKKGAVRTDLIHGRRKRNQFIQGKTMIISLKTKRNLMQLGWLCAALGVLPATAHAENADKPVFNEVNVQHRLVQVFTNNFDETTSHAHAGKIARHIGDPDYSATNYDNFYLALTNEFAADNALGWITNRTFLVKDAAIVANYFYPSVAAAKLVGIDEDKLAQAIFNALTNAMPQKATESADAEYDLAAQSLGSTSQTAVELIQKLDAALAGNKTLGLADDQSKRLTVAYNVAQVIFPASSPNPAPAPAPPDKDNSAKISPPDSVHTNKWRISFSSGAEFMNPYYISVPPGAGKGPNGTLTNSGSSTVAYLQLDVMKQWVFNPGAFDVKNNAQRFPILDAKNLLENLDWQFDIGFLLGNSSKLTNNSYSAQTLAGSDINSQFGVHIPLWRAVEDGVPIQVSLGGSIGITTDHQFEKVHANEFVGGVFDAAIPYNLWGGATNDVGPGLFEARLGGGHLEFPSTTGTADQVMLDGNGIPEFNERWVPVLGFNTQIPFGKSLFLNLEGNTYFGDQLPDQWNVRVGVTVPWGNVSKMITGLGL
jgi:hypothetical protein